MAFPQIVDLLYCSALGQDGVRSTKAKVFIFQSVREHANIFRNVRGKSNTEPLEAEAGKLIT